MAVRPRSSGTFSTTARRSIPNATPQRLVIPGGGYAMTSDREAEPIAMQFLAAGCNAFVLRYSVAPSVFPTALLEAAEAVQRIRAHADDWHCDPQ